MNTVTIVGSINLDNNLRVEQLVRPGETIHAKEHYTAGGGKGANQAVAACRAGSQTHFIGAVGDDAPGQMMRQMLQNEDIDVTGIQTIADQTTGQAFISVDDAGENNIIIYAGANFDFGVSEVQVQTVTIQKSDFVIAQFETSSEATIEAFKLAQASGVKTILNPAPAKAEIAPELLALTDIIIPNETEAQVITGVQVVDEASAKQAATALHALGVAVVIITVGAQGAYYDDGQTFALVPALKVHAVDTTAAGDTFIGALSSILHPDLSNLADAILLANQASSITVQRYGAQPSIPYQKEIEQLSK
ncbi:ribokinase [Bombilactobacillus folatiphilus]|uniref:Ribokinase n=1 Tax=Bombilactobacillus folatiphilus TaxID=2923362 RepID=A0ABY4PBB5_9LACO|nr:ribokinase [Bombilactobacillus folatiphilus]UQS82900.1 ribokinase [Bombilactobacillus folatiphilus]